MDINKLLTAGEWMDVPGIEGLDELEPFRLKIAPVDPLVFMGADVRAEAATEAILALVVGWDLRDGEKDAEFTPASKQVLKRIFFRRVKNAETGEWGELLMNEIVRFAVGPGRLKNSKPISSGLPNGAAKAETTG